MNRTKELIGDMFWQLLEEKPYSKITVHDLVERCQVNRNTFYYHFQDIPALTEYVISTWADAVIQANYQPDTPIRCIEPLAEKCIEQRRALLHLYCSVKREAFVRRLSDLCRHLVKNYVARMSQEKVISDEDKETLIRYYKCAFVGILLDWFDEGATYDLLGFCEKLWGTPEAPGQRVNRLF